MRILVTGGAGYIGSHTVLRLKEAGHYVCVYDNLSKGYKEFIFSDESVKGDVRDKRLLLDTLKQYKINVVMHFAAYIEAGESMFEPGKYFDNNVVGIINLLEAMKEVGVPYLIFSSTAAVYGYPDEVPIKEAAKLQPANVYGETKLIGEKILQWYETIHGLKHISLRYFNAAGAEKKLRTGEWHRPETHLIPLAIKTALGQQEKLLIYGTDYPTQDGTCIRDYIYIEDLVDAHILALNYLVKNNKSDIFNLGSEKGYSVREVVDKVIRVTGKNFKVEEVERRPGDAVILIASSEKIKRVLGWEPKVVNIEEMIETAYQWHVKMGFRG